ncbi:carbon-nitrogen hydrolase family protein [Sinomonas humi]|uniref:Nitrilase n=1 Tax=Sinomonas humi TaxID=1338436 RepID=A0A0B2AR15_9MICC|nr:carbon-nitrogen hydrolase family protein [Sinomonas humi]KHL04323.1 nitrilase [Sinomonas humi]
MRLGLMQAESAVLDVDANLAAVETAAQLAREGGADLLVTPELFPVGYAPRRLRDELDPRLLPEIAQSLLDVARRQGIGLLYSLPEKGEGQWRITASLAGADGTLLAHYVKVHLFGSQEREVFTPGTAPPAVVDFSGMRLGIAVCYDIEFPETARAAALRGAQALLVPTALGMGYDRVPERLIPTRALESQLYVAYANHSGTEDGFALSGGSAVADPFGELIAHAGRGPQLLFADLDPERVEAARRDVPYLHDRRPEVYRGWGH